MDSVAARNNVPDPTPQELIAARAHLRMDAMDGLLVDEVPLNRIADATGTPVWVYSARHMRSRMRMLGASLRDAGVNASIHYAVKANDRLAVLSLFAAEGAGADVVSEGELRRARTAGFAADRIVFSGVGKSDRELRLAIAEEIEQINVESAEELDRVSALATGLGRTARVALRVNPDVDAATHTKITTGRAGDKFGVPFDEAVALYRRAACLPGIEPAGLATHIGSQVLSLAPYRSAFARLAELVRTLRASGHTVRTLDCGGGLGIPYRGEPSPGPAGLAAAIRTAFQDLDVRVMLEPGRWLVGQSGVLLTTVLLVKGSGDGRFIVLDAAMNDLVRPAMYESWHGIVPVSAIDALGPLSPADVVGPVCESSDTFARERWLPALPLGARVAILDAGAYGSVMSSAYNARPPAAEVMVDGDHWAVIRDRALHSDLWRGEHVPDFATPSRTAS